MVVMVCVCVCVLLTPTISGNFPKFSQKFIGNFPILTHHYSYPPYPNSGTSNRDFVFSQMFFPLPFIYYFGYICYAYLFTYKRIHDVFLDDMVFILHFPTLKRMIFSAKLFPVFIVAKHTTASIHLTNLNYEKDGKVYHGFPRENLIHEYIHKQKSLETRRGREVGRFLFPSIIIDVTI